MSRTIYTFAPLGISFARYLEGEQFQPWAFPETQYTADPVLGGSKVYLDIGGDNVATLELIGSCSNLTDRFTLRSGRGVTGVLSNTRGFTNTMTLIKANPLDGNPFTLYLIQLAFVLRPS